MKKELTRKSHSKTTIESPNSTPWVVKNWDKMVSVDFDPKILKELQEILEVDNIYWNETYDCQVRRRNDYTHLSIKRHDNTPIHNWQHMQQIKNDICGEDCEGIELYPSMNRIVDFNNSYHLWVLGPGRRIEVGFRDRLVIPEELRVF